MGKSVSVSISQKITALSLSFFLKLFARYPLKRFFVKRQNVKEYLCANSHKGSSNCLFRFLANVSEPIQELVELDESVVIY